MCCFVYCDWWWVTGERTHALRWHCSVACNSYFSNAPLIVSINWPNTCFPVYTHWDRTLLAASAVWALFHYRLKAAEQSTREERRGEEAEVASSSSLSTPIWRRLAQARTRRKDGSRWSWLLMKSKLTSRSFDESRLKLLLFFQHFLANLKSSLIQLASLYFTLL